MRTKRIIMYIIVVILVLSQLGEGAFASFIASEDEKSTILREAARMDAERGSIQEAKLYSAHSEQLFGSVESDSVESAFLKDLALVLTKKWDLLESNSQTDILLHLRNQQEYGPFIKIELDILDKYYWEVFTDPLFGFLARYYINALINQQNCFFSQYDQVEEFILKCNKFRQECIRSLYLLNRYYHIAVPPQYSERMHSFIEEGCYLIDYDSLEKMLDNPQQIENDNKRTNHIYGTNIWYTDPTGKYEFRIYNFDYDTFTFYGALRNKGTNGYLSIEKIDSSAQIRDWKLKQDQNLWSINTFYKIDEINKTDKGFFASLCMNLLFEDRLFRADFFHIKHHFEFDEYESDDIFRETPEKTSDEFANSLADSIKISGLYTYTIRGNGTVSITDYDWSSSTGDIYIPFVLDGYPVTAIGNEAFANGKEENKNDVMIIIPNSVTKIGEKAFFNSPVTSVSIPSSVDFIGKGAFGYCKIKQFIVDPAQNFYTTIDGALYDKRNRALIAYPQARNALTKIPEGIQSIGEYAFSGLTIGQDVSSSICFTDIVPSTLIKIDPLAFENCTIYYSMNNMTDDKLAQDHITLLPDSLKYIGESAFAGCLFKANSSPRRDKIVIAENLEDIGDYAFSGCRFYDNFSFELLISGQGMSRIGKYAFASPVTKAGDRNSIKLVLPASINDIGSHAFYMTYPVRIQENTTIGRLDTGSFYDTIVYSEADGSDLDIESNSLVINGTIRAIPTFSFAFENNGETDNVKSITIQEGVTIIEDSAFAGRKNLEMVSLPMTITEIGENAFAGCTNLVEITVPESVTQIGERAFEKQVITLIVKENSYAARWASENGYNYRYEDRNDSLDWLNTNTY